MPISRKDTKARVCATWGTSHFAPAGPFASMPRLKRASLTPRPMTCWDGRIASRLWCQRTCKIFHTHRILLSSLRHAPICEGMRTLSTRVVATGWVSPDLSKLRSADAKPIRHYLWHKTDTQREPRATFEKIEIQQRMGPRWQHFFFARKADPRLAPFHR